MLSRIFWVGIAGLALVTGMVLQDGDRFFSWANDHTDVGVSTERAIEARVDRAIDRSFDGIQVVGADGRQIDLAAHTKRDLAEAVGRLVKAETHLALLRIRDASAEEMHAAGLDRDRARAEVETLKSQIAQQDQASKVEREAIREQIERDVREDIRATVRDAVRN